MSFDEDYQSPNWAEHWHIWNAIIPRRSITGKLLYGRVLRRRDGRRWIYKKFVGFEPNTD